VSSTPLDPPIHVIIPDTQVRPGVPTDHLAWIGQYIVDKFAGKTNVKLKHLGDHWDMHSLSSYNSKHEAEGTRLRDDIDAGNDGFALLNAPIEQYNRRRPKAKRWEPDRDIYLGNHEYRLIRYLEDHPELLDALSLDQLNTRGWRVHDFLEPHFDDGVCYAHYFYGPNSPRPYSGENVGLRLNKIGHSFTMGHQQGLLYGVRPTLRGMMHGLVAGSCYLHDEDYRGPQQKGEWRGIVVCHEVIDGAYDPMFVSLNFLCRRYEGCTLAKFMRKVL
jgi:hypothetical protein